MTNMMNGAVAIYGGVGVMEIRQPLPQAVESVAQAVEALAVNAHISLRELKNCVDKVLEKKIPGYKQLMAIVAWRLVWATSSSSRMATACPAVPLQMRISAHWRMTRKSSAAVSVRNCRITCAKYT